MVHNILKQYFESFDRFEYKQYKSRKLKFERLFVSTTHINNQKIEPIKHYCI